VTARRRVVIAGAGIAGLEAALALRRLAAGLVDVTVVSPEREFVYRPLAVTAPFGDRPADRFPLAELVEGAGARLRTGAVREVDPERHRVIATDGEEIPYDALIVACGGRHVPAVEGAVAFPTAEATEAIREILEEAAAGRVERIAFALPARAGWALPLYELALLTAARLGDAAHITLVTPEPEPLAVFGAAASEAVGGLLREQGIELRTRAYPIGADGGRLRVTPGSAIEAERVIALARLEGPGLAGLPSTAGGFLPVDRHGAVIGVDGGYAAGDVTDFPVKQGGLAAQQADAAAEAVASRAGAEIVPTPFTPVLRGLLLTAGVPRYLRVDLASGHGDTSRATSEALWWPPGKIVGRELAPYLASRAGIGLRPPPEGGIAVEIRLPPEPVDG
jgi:sulfide:quinone oxidoreductase